MKFNGKHIAIAAGLGAVLALSPVAGTVGMAFASNDGAAQAQASQGIFIAFSITDPSTGTQTNMPNLTLDEARKLKADEVPNVPSYEGYEFKGWKDPATGDIYSSADLQSVVMWESATFESVWEPIQPEGNGTVWFQVKDPETGEVSYEIGSPLDAEGKLENGAPETPALDGYEFVGWAVDGNVYTAGALERKTWTDGTTFVAQWAPASDTDPEEPVEPEQPEERYITVEYYDGEELLGTGAVLNGTNAWSGVANPAKDGYVFEGWSFEGDTILYKDLSCVRVAYDSSVEKVKLFANWSKAPEDARYVPVNYWDGEELLGTGAVLNGTAEWSGVANPTKDGYTFTGWSFEGETVQYADLSSVRVALDEGVTEVNVYANWQKDEAPVSDNREIKVNYWDGEELLGTGSVFNGTSQWSGVASPAKDGYTFAGWSFEGETTVYTDDELTGIVYAADEAVTEINLYANWEKTPEEARYITVNYWDGEELLGTGAVLNGTNQWSGVTNPAKDGYIFAGWRFEGDSVATPDLDRVVFAGDETVTEINLYAEWAQAPVTETHKVTFDDCLSNTENMVVEVEDGEIVAKPADPTCEGWKFEGWYVDTALTQAYDFSAPVTADMTLYAKWSQVEGAAEDDAKPEQPAAEEQASDAVLPETGDIAAIATAVAGVAGAGIAGAGVVLNKRRK